MPGRYFSLLFAAALTVSATASAFAAYDAPTLSYVTAGHGKIVLDVTAGPSGAPAGFSVYWMTQQEYDDYGSVWPSTNSYPGLHWASFTGVPTLNTGDGAYTTYQLAPFQSVQVEIGDLGDESTDAVTTNTPEELDYGFDWGMDYVVCVYANGGGGNSRSAYSLNAAGTTTLVSNCTYTQGYWKNHEEAWPVNNLTLGTVNYTKAQLLLIFGQPVQGNGLISLAHQLIAAKLNIANGASSSAVAATIAAADAQIGALVVPPIGSGSLSTSSTSSKTQILDNYNNGIIGPGHCNDTANRGSTWGMLKSLYR